VKHEDLSPVVWVAVYALAFVVLALDVLVWRPG
jgi:hypothetical protein